MSKRQLIDQIRELNPTAEPTFLAQFEETDLEQYLNRLQGSVEKRLRIATWTRRNGELRKVS